MYTVSKGPSKIVAKTRRGINQNLERLDSHRDTSKKPLVGEQYNEIYNVPRPVFHSNGNKRNFHSQQYRNNQDIISPQHEEIIRFIHESWTLVYHQCEQPNAVSTSKVHAGPKSQSVVFYNDGEPNAILQNFKPFDLESWWGKRLYNNITKSL